jgi:hypothetical protein
MAWAHGGCTCRRGRGSGTVPGGARSAGCAALRRWLACDEARARSKVRLNKHKSPALRADPVSTTASAPNSSREPCPYQAAPCVGAEGGRPLAVAPAWGPAGAGPAPRPPPRPRRLTQTAVAPRRFPTQPALAWLRAAVAVEAALRAASAATRGPPGRCSLWAPQGGPRDWAACLCAAQPSSLTCIRRACASYVCVSYVCVSYVCAQCMGGARTHPRLLRPRAPTWCRLGSSTRSEAAVPLPLRATRPAWDVARAWAVSGAALCVASRCTSQGQGCGSGAGGQGGLTSDGGRASSPSVSGAPELSTATSHMPWKPVQQKVGSRLPVGKRLWSLWSTLLEACVHLATSPEALPCSWTTNACDLALAALVLSCQLARSAGVPGSMDCRLRQPMASWTVSFRGVASTSCASRSLMAGGSSASTDSSASL